MREIKFRAFSNGQWWYSNDEAYLLKEYDGELFLVEDTQFYLSDSPRYAKIGKAIQFTGLCDKNGKEIFEGDILKKIIYKSGTVVFWEGSFCLDFGKGLTSENALTNYAPCRLWEIIGNIHENPELLK